MRLKFKRARCHSVLIASHPPKNRMNVSRFRKGERMSRMKRRKELREGKIMERWEKDTESRRGA